MNETSRRVWAFTLVELLVVVSVLALLIAMLTPVLNKARYQAGIVSCMSQIRQMGTGILSYVQDNRGWYPDGAWGKPDPAIIAQQETSGFGIIGGPGDFDFRATYREYFGARLNDIMKCPLSSEFWQTANGGGDRSDIDRYNMGAESHAKSPYNFYFGQRAWQSWRDVGWARDKTMRRMGERWVPANALFDDVELNILMSDFAWRDGYFGTWLASTHQPAKHSVRQVSGFQTSNAGYAYDWEQYVAVNFALDDNSVSTYSLAMDSLLDNTAIGIRRQTTMTYVVPESLSR